MSAPYIVDILGRTRMDLDVKRSKLLFSCPGKVSAGIPAMIFGASSVAAGLAAMVCIQLPLWSSSKIFFFSCLLFFQPAIAKKTYIRDFPHYYIFIYLCCKAPLYFSPSNEMDEALYLTKNKYLLWILNKGCRRLNVIPFSNNQSECWRCYSNLLPNLLITVFERKIQILRLFLKPWIRSFPKAWLMSR